MRRLAAVLKECWIRQTLYSLNRTLKFVLRNFKVNTDYVPGYEGFLITFNTLRLLSRKHKGGWPSGSDLTTVDNLIKLFRYYSHHFSHNQFNELPTTVPSLLLSLMLSEERDPSIDDLFFTFPRIRRVIWRFPSIIRHSVICTRE